MMSTGTKILLGVLAVGALVGGIIYCNRKQLPPSTKKPLVPAPTDTSQWLLTPVTTKEAQAVLKQGASLVKTSELPPNLIAMLKKEVGDWGMTRPTVHVVSIGAGGLTPITVYVADFSRFSKTANWIIAEEIAPEL